MTSTPEQPTGTVQYLNPETMHRNPAYSQAVVVTGPVKTVYIGGQNAVDATGAIVGKGDIAAQTEQVLRNIKLALEAAGAGPEHVIKWTIFLVHGQSLEAGFGAFQRVWGRQAHAPAISAAMVAGLARPEFLVEMEAIAVVPL